MNQIFAGQTQIRGKRKLYGRRGHRRNWPVRYIWTVWLLALLSKQMWNGGLALPGAFLLSGDDGVRDETSGRKESV